MYRFLRGRSSRRKIYKVRLALFLPAKVDFWILRKSCRGPVYTNPLWHDFYRLKATSVDYWRFVLSQLLELSTDVLRLFAPNVKMFSNKTNFYTSTHKLVWPIFIDYSALMYTLMFKLDLYITSISTDKNRDDPTGPGPALWFSAKTKYIKS